jgi:hypothetical protein
MASPEKRPSWGLALGREAPPDPVELPGGTYRLEKVFKHDFFAFTACYRRERDRDVDPSDRIILKIGRKAPLFGLPLSWIGRLHARHEGRALAAVDDLDVVPRFTGYYGKYGLSHAYVEGSQLGSVERVPDDYFARLREGLAKIHQRKMAYVDLEKLENVLVGDDGRPYLFDFQIAYRWPFRHGGELWPFRWLRTRLQHADEYHVGKLQRRMRRDQMTADEIVASRRRPLPVRLWSVLTRPIVRVRRRVLHTIDPRATCKRRRNGSIALRRRGECGAPQGE